MCDVPEFRDGPTAFRSPEATIDYFRKKFVDNLARYCDVSRATLLDCGCSEGWNILAFLLAGGHAAIGVDMNETALRVARKFSQILGIEDRAVFCCASATQLPISDKSTDIVCCIETLEHLYGGAPQALAELNRVARSVVLISTPNKLSPVIAHDTRLPFAHYLPPRWRRPYARLFGKQDDQGNLFVGPFQVKRSLSDFTLASTFLGFPSFAEFVESFPHYLPYMGEGIAGVRDLSRLKRWYYALHYRLLGEKSFYILPSLTGIFTRSD